MSACCTHTEFLIGKIVSWPWLSYLPIIPKIAPTTWCLYLLIALNMVSHRVVQMIVCPGIMVVVILVVAVVIITTLKQTSPLFPGCILQHCMWSMHPKCHLELQCHGLSRGMFVYTTFPCCKCAKVIV